MARTSVALAVGVIALSAVAVALRNGVELIGEQPPVRSCPGWRPSRSRHPRLRLPDDRAQPHRGYPLLTPEFRREYQDRHHKDVIPQARDRQLVSQVNVVGVGMLDAHRDSDL